MEDSKELKPHKEKKRKERKKEKKEKKHKHREQHKERKHKHRKHQEHAAPEAADPEAAAAGAGSAAAGAVDKGFDQQEYVMRILFDDGRSQEGLPSVDIPAVFTEEHEAEELVPDEDTISLRRARAKEEEVWVLRLPDGVDVDCLDGQVIHLPCEPPEARHIRPPKDLLSGRYDLLAYVKAAVKPTPLGHLELGPQEPDNPDDVLHSYRHLHQEGEHFAARLRVAGFSGGEPQEGLKTAKVARLISVGDDTFTLQRRALITAMTEGIPLWGDEDGWDGQLPPRKRRKRVAGWDVVGDKPPQQQQPLELNSGSSDRPFAAAAGVGLGSVASDDEFDEVVFLPEKEVPFLKEDQEKQQQLEEEQKAAGYGPEQIQQELTAALHEELVDPVDWDERHYHPGWDDPNYEPEPQPHKSEESEDLEEIDLYNFLLSLPVKAEVVAQQEAYAQKVAQQQQQQQQQQGPGVLTPGNPQAQQQYSTQASPFNYSPVTPSTAGKAAAAGSGAKSGKGGADVVTTRGDSDDDDESDDFGYADYDEYERERLAEQEKAAAAALPPPKPIPELLAAVEDVDFILLEEARDANEYVKMRNKVVKKTLDYEDLCAQIDMDAMDDDVIELLLPLLEEKQRELNGTAAREADSEAACAAQVARLLLPDEGPAPRPHFKQVDQGYAPYQVDDEGREYIVIPPPSPDWEVTDGHLADRVLQSGAAKLHKFVSTHELRSKGFEWDSDPEDERREGLQISLPDGRTMHIPSGLHFDFS